MGVFSKCLRGYTFHISSIAARLTDVDRIAILSWCNDVLLDDVILHNGSGDCLNSTVVCVAPAVHVLVFFFGGGGGGMGGGGGGELHALTQNDINQNVKKENDEGPTILFFCRGMQYSYTCKCCEIGQDRPNVCTCWILPAIGLDLIK